MIQEEEIKSLWDLNGTSQQWVLSRGEGKYRKKLW